MKFVVFDTGMGGRLFARALRRAFPLEEVVEVIDVENSPYGGRSDEEIRELTEAALGDYVRGEAVVVVLACNTASAVCLDYFRAKYPGRIFVGFEPMLKPAVEVSQNKKIIVLATDATRRSERYQSLRRKYCGGVEIYEPDCGSWAAKIDAGVMRDEDVAGVLVPYLELGGDVVVLACTHYVALEDMIKAMAPGVVVMEPFEAVIARIRGVL